MINKQHIYNTKCIVCDAQVYDYEPQMCCDGRECGCMGKPLEPPLCSTECEEKVFGKYVGVKEETEQ
ncbi:hypothetical protein D3P07_11465 [Paenibacillus sp. 1011MAR3C5]|nr:hypothetical protein D3P07_11465 [Paenibacillus sp. 1011MAR3C5]